MVQVSCSAVSSSGGSYGRKKQAVGGAAHGANLLGTAFRSTVIAAVRQPVRTMKLGLASLWSRSREIVGSSLPVDLTPQPMPSAAPGTWQFENLLDAKGFPRTEMGSLEWLVDGKGFFPEMDRQIAAARHSIDVQVFIFDNDDIAVKYADVFRKRASELPVRVLYDDLGSTFAQGKAPETRGPPGFEPPDDMHDYLRANSKLAARRTLNPWMTCDHTKLLVFDQRTAIVGGMNIGREYFSEWHDLMVRVEGPIVQTLAHEFKESWRRAGPLGDFTMGRQPMTRTAVPVAGGIPLRVLRTDLAEGRHEILDATLLAIRGARKRIWIQNPYFGNREVALAVESAARRGVDVRVIIPAAGDSPIMDVGNLITARDLILAGAKIFRYPRVTHMKVMICDGWASVGSANLDTLSLRINRELNLAFSDRAEIRELENKVFFPDFRKSTRVLLSETKTPAAAVTRVIVGQL